MFVLTPEEMQGVDQAAVAAGFPDLLLMETAGRGVAEEAARLMKELYQDSAGEVLIFAGKGNNGGDGLVAARFLDMWGYRVRIILSAPGDSLKGSPEVNLRLCQLREIEILEVDDSGGPEGLISRYLRESELVIDAMLGTGLKGVVREPAAGIITLINSSQRPVLAVDIPSGVNGLNGRVSGEAVEAYSTITMAYPKPGLLLFPGREYVGELRVVDLGVPAHFYSDVRQFMLTEDEAALLLPGRPVTAHKGTFGQIGIIGGMAGMAGAPALSGMAALKTGAGLVRLAVPAEIQATAAGWYPELITLPLENGVERESGELTDLIAKSDVLAAGPGLGCSEKTARGVYWLLERCELPLVLDADGLNVIEDTGVFKRREAPLIITPHPGEMARLLKTSTGDIQKDRVGTARSFAREHNLCLVLKGAATVIALPDGRVYLNPTGNQGMASAGSGDVLTGIISGLLAQGLGTEMAAVLGSYLHGLAGDLIGEESSCRSLTATDLIDYLPGALYYLEKILIDPL